MSSTNKSRHIIASDDIEDYINGRGKEHGTVLQLSEHHYITIKNYKPQRANSILNNLQHKTKAIDTRKRLLEKLNAKCDVKRISAIDKEEPLRLQGGILGQD